MYTKLLCSILFMAFAIATQASTPVSQSITLTTKDIAGRFITQRNANNKSDIYIFREDNTFHRANDSGELLFFNVVGKYKLSNDSIIIDYQDFSRGNLSATKIRKMYLQATNLSNNDMHIDKTENNRTEKIYLRRQNTQ